MISETVCVSALINTRSCDADPVEALAVFCVLGRVPRGLILPWCVPQRPHLVLRGTRGSVGAVGTAPARTDVAEIWRAAFRPDRALGFRGAGTNLWFCVETRQDFCGFFPPSFGFTAFRNSQRTYAGIYS